MLFSCAKKSLSILAGVSPAWAKASHQPGTKSRMQGGNELHEAGRREVSGFNASEGIEPRNHYRSRGRHAENTWKAAFFPPYWRGGEGLAGLKSAA